MILLAQNQKCTFNPAVTTILGANDKGLWIAVAIGSQFAGAFIAGLIGLLSFSNYVKDVPYLDQATLRYFSAVFIGEIVGSLILTSGFLFKYDEVLDFGKDQLENGIVISSLKGVGRATRYVAQSCLNPVIAASLISFECCKEGEWSRFWNSQIFIGLPIPGAFLALSYVNLLYKLLMDKILLSSLRMGDIQLKNRKECHHFQEEEHSLLIGFHLTYILNFIRKDQAWESCYLAVYQYLIELGYFLITVVFVLMNKPQDGKQQQIRSMLKNGILIRNAFAFSQMGKNDCSIVLSISGCELPQNGKGLVLLKDNKLQFISSLNANFGKLLNKQFGTSISTQFKDNLAQIQQQESVYQYQWQEVPDRYEVSQEPDDQKPKNLLDCHKKCIRKNSCHIINNKLAGLQKEVILLLLLILGLRRFILLVPLLDKLLIPQLY